MSEIRHWPQCGHCSNEKRGWQPVEAYGVVEEEPTRLIVQRRMVVWAECSHGHADERKNDGRKPDRDEAVIDIPMWWGEGHRLAAIRRLVFFAPGRRKPDHGLVTSIT